MVRFDSLCIVWKVLYTFMVLCTGSSLGLGLVGGSWWGAAVYLWAATVLLQVCIGKSKLANWSLCWKNCSNHSAKGQWVAVSLRYSSDNSLSSSGIGCYGGARSTGDESWKAGTSSVSWLLYLVTMPCVLQYIPKMFSRAFRGDCLCLWDMCGCSGGAGYRGLSHLPGNGCDEHVGSSSSVQVRGFVKRCRWDPISDRWALDLFTGRYIWLFYCEVSYHGTSVRVQNCWCR